MDNLYGGNRDEYEQMRDTILRFTGIDVDPTLRSAGERSSEESTIRLLLLKGHKIEAIKALRSKENLGLTEAKRRVDQIDREMRAGY